MSDKIRRACHSLTSGFLRLIRCINNNLFPGQRDPSEINISRLVRETEDELNVLDCVERPGYCRIERVCVLRRALRDASAAFLSVLDSYTLADLIEPRKALANL